MAGKGGGAWKVAYADFVTAMMAFFMVMWLLAQSKEKREAVAHYFTDPSGIRPIGFGRTPRAAGALMNDTHAQNVPDSEHVIYPRDGAGEFETGVVRNWIVNNEERHQRWLERARLLGERARRSRLVTDSVLSKDQAVRVELAHELKDAVSAELLVTDHDLAGEMLSASLTAVNWSRISQELLTGE